MGKGEQSASAYPPRDPASQVLREDAEGRYRLLLDHIDEIVYMISFTPGAGDPFSSPAAFVNDSIQRILGWSPEEFVADPNLWFSLLHPDDVPGVVSQTRMMIGSKQTTTRDYRMRHRGGDYRWIEDRAVPRLDESGRLVGFFGVARDVTERKLAEENLQRVSERLRLATEAAGVGIWDWDIATDRVVWDEVMYRLYGTTPDRFSGKYTAWEAAVHSSDRSRVRREVQQSLRGERQFDTEFRVVWPNGTVRALKANALVQRGQDRRPVRMLGTNWDITERKAAEEALRRSQASLETAVATAELASWEFSPTKGSGVWSALMYELYYRDPALGPPRGAEFLALIHPDDRHAVVTANRAAWRHSEPVTLDFRTNPENGTPRHLTCTVRRLTDERNQPSLLVGTVLDITQRKRAEEQIRSSLNEKEVLLREIHHRVKNNLQIVVSLLSLQGERIREAGTRESLIESQNRIRSMALIHESLYRSENLAQIDLAQYVERLCRYLYRSYGVDPQRIRLQLELAHNRLDIDRAVTCGLLINELVSNALVHAFPDGRSGTLTVRFAADGGILRLTVRDDGVGLACDPLAVPPTSLGLTLVADLARQLGAELTVDRTAGTEYRIAFSEV